MSGYDRAKYDTIRPSNSLRETFMSQHPCLEQRRHQPQLLMQRWRWLALAIGLMCANGASGADPASLDPHLESLRPFLDKTWKGAFKNSTPEKPIVDVSRWERALNGKAIRVLHSVNDGAYGGETLILWDAQKEQLTYHYFTTAGFRTEGTMTVSDKKITSLEQVKGNANGISEVRGISEVLADGTLQVKTEYKKEGEWQPGREVIYREDAKAKVVFQ
jgi:hypothetical protein